MHVILFIGGNNEVELGSGNRVKPGQLSPQQDAAISLNASLIDERDNVGIFFALYDTPCLLYTSDAADE